MDQMMNNPQMMAIAQAMMQDPEVMMLMQQPGMMEKLQAAMQNPATAMNDPDVMKIAMKLQGMGMGGGGGGMGGMGDMGGYGGGGGGYAAPAAASAASGSDPFQHVTTSAQLSSILASAGSKLVVVDYFTTWCGPCKAIAPTYAELATRYAGKVICVKIDGDRARELVQEKGVQGYPTFEFYQNGSKIDSFSGADQSKLRSIIEEHGEKGDVPPPCPYKHFPLRESETVKYAEIKWEMVAPKFAEVSAKLEEAHAGKLSPDDLRELDALVATLKDRQSYHSSSVSSKQIAVVNRMLATWPKDSMAAPLNLVRMAVFHPEAAKAWAEECDKKGAGDLVSPLLKLALGAEKPVQALLSVRILCNAFSRRVLAKAVVRRYEDILEACAALYRKHADENLRLSCVSLYINYAILLAEDSKANESAKVLLLSSAQEALGLAPSSPKLAYRLLVVLGTLLYGDAHATELARDLDLADAASQAASTSECKGDEQTQQVAKEIEHILKK